MFGRWGALVYRFRRPIVLLTIVLAVASLGLASQASGELSSGGWLDRGSESARVADRIAAEYGTGRSSLIVLFRAGPGVDAASAAFQAQVHQSLVALAADGRVAGIVGYAETHQPRFIARDGNDAYVVVQLNATDEESVTQFEGLRAEVVPPPGVQVEFTGYGPLTLDSSHQSEVDLQQAETVSLPVALIILVAVFGSVLAAGLPLLVAGLAIPSALALVWMVAQRVEMSIFVLNVGTMLGLALAIDYSLFLVSRFREELARGRTPGEAVERAVATSGKAIAFSGSAVAIGLAGLFFLKAPALASIGIGGALVVLSAVFYALTFLPAALGMLGPRVNALSVTALLRRVRRRPAQPDDTVVPIGRWERIARWVMSHPVMVFTPVLAVLVIAGTPFLHMEQGVPGATIYPPGLPSRDAYVTLQEHFPPGETTPIQILATVHGDPTSPANARALSAYAAELGRLPNVSRVESPFSSLTDPRTGAPMGADEVAALWSGPAAGRPQELQQLAQAYIRGSTVQLDVISPLDPSLPEAAAMIPTIRGLPAGDGIHVQVGGAAATGYDFLSAVSERLPLVVGIVLAAMLAILFLLFGSVVLPVKAVVMTLLSVSASFGALVWIFQDGNLSGLLDFQPLGYTIAGNPVIMFCVLFGLSMDYEVLLLSRIQEAYRRTGDNTASVAEGLARTAAVITGAALIMVTVFAAFALARVITIKSLGIGMAIAVLVDATVIRVFLVPATMRLLGRWNWWAPGRLARLAVRLGFSHADDDAGGHVPSRHRGGDPEAVGVRS